MKDWVIRSLKTFVQAFFGVLIPAICTMLNDGWPESWDKIWVVLAPTIAAALSAAICAVWNIIREELEKDKTAAAAIATETAKKPWVEPKIEFIHDPDGKKQDTFMEWLKEDQKAQEAAKDAKQELDDSSNLR